MIDKEWIEKTRQILKFDDDVVMKFGSKELKEILTISELGVWVLERKQLVLDALGALQASRSMHEKAVTEARNLRDLLQTFKMEEDLGN